MKFKIAVILLICNACNWLYAQVVFEQTMAISESGQNPHRTAILDINSDQKGVLLPHIDTSVIHKPATGLLAFYQKDSSYTYFDGSSWQLFVKDSQLDELKTNNLSLIDSIAALKHELELTQLQLNRTILSMNPPRLLIPKGGEITGLEDCISRLFTHSSHNNSYGYSISVSDAICPNPYNIDEPYCDNNGRGKFGSVSGPGLRPGVFQSNSIRAVDANTCNSAYIYEVPHQNSNQEHIPVYELILNADGKNWVVDTILDDRGPRLFLTEGLLGSLDNGSFKLYDISAVPTKINTIGLDELFREDNFFILNRNTVIQQDRNTANLKIHRFDKTTLSWTNQSMSTVAAGKLLYLGDSKFMQLSGLRLYVYELEQNFVGDDILTPTHNFNLGIVNGSVDWDYYATSLSFDHFEIANVTFSGEIVTYEIDLRTGSIHHLNTHFLDEHHGFKYVKYLPYGRLAAASEQFVYLLTKGL